MRKMKKLTNRETTLILLLLLAVLLMACETGMHRDPEPHVSFTYEVVYIEGMPCIVVDYATSSSAAVFGITCDWSQWEGEP